MENVVKGSHSLIIKDRITVTGLKSVVSLGEKEVKVALDGRYLLLTGDGFSAERLSVDEGVLVLAGEVSSLRYSSAIGAKSLFKRLLK